MMMILSRYRRRRSRVSRSIDGLVFPSQNVKADFKNEIFERNPLSVLNLRFSRDRRY